MTRRPEQGAAAPTGALLGSMQRRWVVCPPGRPAAAATLVVQVVDGHVVVDAPRGPVTLPPRDVERLRHCLAAARAAAIWDRGGW